MNLPPPGTLLVLLAVTCGLAAWVYAVFRGLRRERVLGPPARKSVAVWGAAAGVGVWVVATLVAGLLPEDGVSPLVRSLLRAGAIAAGAAGVWALAAPRIEPSPRSFVDDLRDGAMTFLLTLPPTAAAFLLTLPDRTVEGSNPLLLQLIDGSAGTWALVCLSAVAFAPVGEELLFRGLLLGSLRTAGLSAGPAIVGTAALFAFLHQPQDWAALFALACVLGWSRERTGSVRPAILAHAAFNALMLAWVLLDGSAGAA
ncbi:CPBP family intramembrane glutamic endopeptidase [Alienimonas californiensis]|uniref:CAAX amino terminal protease self-immunity n=1 Tax=Alienimonas californiensis TaxID=2527989 RepID=A0A517PEN3_9PLAN|nr:CPBP family intramembrane glutamic endopeptidase [Alienimonas californiensis]QDT17828.1 CAAX amino terminal protease self- immunity [Alienimonas californiensis]